MRTAHVGEGRVTVLVVEDDDDLRVALMHGLEAEGFTVEAVASASDAYAVAERLRPDLVLLDWWLGEGEMGAVACRRLVEMTAAGPVVMHTGMDDARDRAAAYRAGAAAFLTKGLPLEELAARLRRVLADDAA
jgi:DNA-binding response OmpR family regulator